MTTCALAFLNGKERILKKPAILTRLNWDCIPNNRLLLKVANWNVVSDTRWYWIESEVVQSSFKKFTQSSSPSSASVNFYLSIYLPPIDQSVITARLKICRRWEISKDNRRIIRFESCGLEVFWSTGRISFGVFELNYSFWKHSIWITRSRHDSMAVFVNEMKNCILAHPNNLFRERFGPESEYHCHQLFRSLIFRSGEVILS